ncbi:Cardiolipin synthase A [Candidatus Rhabdochlamydia oedothoracis]|uniref:Cardiolipin synthase A n=1 Tax=Candidatus Rhabdochlamydia oedothoracis TaxID=2720720 RepID=A0ABX8V3X0_9BACT|nr:MULTISPECIES: phospholipase D-like domain-containing protein [Rhabdochlamydia]KAG6559343.1 Cardiolipin synthase A [Candidatus Rhabdochlamydia sp. W815]MCL6755909.1 phospholipase D-like domain-containing protein [Candidatus Rhabdochlamydia oedothoracis]QYF49192.1 Cardiolipin synthase A [Candidatus Rhabdochlamydia oedothoracis]
MIINNINNSSGPSINQKETNKQQSSLAYKTCLFVLKTLCLVKIFKFIFSIKIIPAGSIGSFSGSAYCIYTKQLFSNSASTIASLLRGRKTIFLGLAKELMQSIRQPIAQNQFSACNAIACQNTMESFEWKKTLIQSADHNIVLSGNYCGGKAFDELLSIVKDQLEKKSQLKVVILSSDKFIDPSNREKISYLMASYSDRFQLVESPDIWTIGEKVKLSTNHSKILSIDYGKYFILGGSGIEDKYAYDDGLNDKAAFFTPHKTGLLHKILPRSFRDQDFVFYDEKGYEGVGGRVHIEAIQLAYAWMHYNKSQEQGSVTEKILLDQAINRSSPIVHTRIEQFHQNLNMNKDVNTKVLFTGPENTNNVFEQELIMQFDRATSRIVIDHMYFHPSQAIFDALVNAANRGIPVNLITNGYDKNSPMGHKAFGPRNRFNYIAFKNAVHKEYQEHINIYEFKVHKTTLHKKVIIVDDTIIAGSSNFGYKSLGPNSDHEINFIAKSALFAEQTLEAIKVDYQENHSKPVSKVTRLTIPEFVRTIIHSLSAFLVG